MIQIAYGAETWTFNRRLTVIQMLTVIKVLPETVLVVSNGQLIAEDQYLMPGDLVKVVSVVSGG
ncbi:MAG: thiamine biosynthesis protein ThiS [Anaerolineae bacterium]|nr:thiamine biosynthesis protein ThiS [Anaerolineae bacterium]